MAKSRRLNAQQRGRVSETLVAIRYKLMGYRVLYRNWRIPGGELDLVLRRGSQVVVVEVRARCFQGLLHPVDTITTAKKRTLHRSLQHCYHRIGSAEQTWRLDVASVRWWLLLPWIEVQRDVQFEWG